MKEQDTEAQLWRELQAGVDKAIEGLQAVSRAIVRHKTSQRRGDQRPQPVDERKAA